MTRVIVREYIPEDYFAIEAQEFAKVIESEDEKITTAVSLKRAGPHRTILSPIAEIIACVGIHLMWPGTGQAWGLFSPLMKKYPMAWFEVKRLLKEEQKKNRLRRVQAITRCDWPEAMRFLEHLGFHPEGKLEAYGPWEADSMMYALVERS